MIRAAVTAGQFGEAGCGPAQPWHVGALAKGGRAVERGEPMWYTDAWMRQDDRIRHLSRSNHDAHDPTAYQSQLGDVRVLWAVLPGV